MTQSILQGSNLGYVYEYELETRSVAMANNSEKKPTEKKKAEVFGYGINLI